jgi:hypothetical protein
MLKSSCGCVLRLRVAVIRQGRRILKQADCEMREIVTVRDRRRDGSAARDDLEIRELDLSVTVRPRLPADSQ